MTKTGTGSLCNLTVSLPTLRLPHPGVVWILISIFADDTPGR